MAQEIVAPRIARTQPLVLRRPWLVLTMLSGLAVVGAFGNAWDLYWHIMIGRDTFWIPPHTLMYAAIAASGLLAAAVVLTTTWQPEPRGEVVTFLGFRAPLGIIVLGLGALQMVISAPFDDWWHRLYGVDVTVWSPPHLVGFSGAVVMLAGLIIAVLAERKRTELAGPLLFWTVALLFALVVRWITFLNSTTLTLSWLLKRDRFAIVGPWAGWWGLWASLCMAWIFTAASRCWSPQRRWQLPLAVGGVVLALRGLEWVVSAIGFQLVLPWGTQTLHGAFRPLFDYDLGLWVMTLVLILPIMAQALLTRWTTGWPAGRFGLWSGLLWGTLLGLEFGALRTPLHLVPLGAAQVVAVVVVCVASGLLGGLLGSYQGDWLARFRR